MTSLSHLITKLETTPPKSVKYPKCLVKSLKQLHSIEGMQDLKESVAKQTSYIIYNPSFVSAKKKPMLNTVLYGPPGVGKTTVGIILAKVWMSIGIIGEEVGTFEKLEMKNGVKTEGQREYFYLTFLLGGLYFLYVMFQIFSDGVKTNKKLEATGVNTNIFKIVNYCFISLLVLILLGFFIFTKKKSSNSSLKKWEKDEIEDVDEKSVIDIISRDDLVSQYVGNTAIKTREVLTKSIGKVLFIDEAYSIVNGDYDHFGAEALSTINLFLSQHPGKVIVILAGYKDLLQRKVFAAQPGLPRRFMWHFTIAGYTPEELLNIFKKQLLLSDSLKIKRGDESKILYLFSERSSSFPNYGGDTERLVFYIQINRTSIFESGKNFEMGDVSFEEVERALISLDKNALTPSGKSLEEKTTPLEKASSLFSNIKFPLELFSEIEKKE